MSAMKILPTPRKSKQVSFRVDEKTHGALLRAARRFKSTPSAVMQAALHGYLSQKEGGQ